MNREKDDRVDRLVSRLLAGIAALIVGTWVWNGAVWTWDWYSSVSAGEDAVWSAVWDFCRGNFSILVVIYGLLCLQVSGIAELKFEKNFLKAFVLALVLTPPLMMATYGRRKKSGMNSKEEK